MRGMSREVGIVVGLVSTHTEYFAWHGMSRMGISHG